MYFINYDSLFNDTIINEGDLHMIPEYIQNIILRYDKEVCNEISAINLAIERIKDSLKVINEVISSDLFSYMKSDKIFDKEKENQLLQDAQTVNPVPSRNGRIPKIYYMTQASVKPPTFILFVNEPELIHFSYMRFLENRLRESFGFEGTPIRLILRGKKREDEE